MYYFKTLFVAIALLAVCTLVFSEEGQDAKNDVNGFEWKAAFNTAFGKSGNLDNPLPDMFFGWVLTLNDSMKMWKGHKKIYPANFVLAAVATPSWGLSKLIMPGVAKRTVWRLQAGPSVGSQSASENATEYFQSLLKPANAGISVTSYWLHTDLDGSSEKEVRAAFAEKEESKYAESAVKLYGGYKTFGAVGWGIKFFSPYKGDYIDYSGTCNPQDPESSCTKINTSDFPVDGLIQHYFRGGLGLQLGKHFGVSGCYTIAYHDVRKSSRDTFVQLFGHHPERDGFQYLILNLQIALNPEKITPTSGGWYLDLTFYQQTEHNRWMNTPFDDREVLTVGLRKDMRELPLAFSN